MPGATRSWAKCCGTRQLANVDDLQRGAFHTRAEMQAKPKDTPAAAYAAGTFPLAAAGYTANAYQRSEPLWQY